VNNLTIKVIDVNHIIFWDVIFKFELLMLHNLFSKLLARRHIIIQQHIFLVHYYSLSFVMSFWKLGFSPLLDENNLTFETMQHFLVFKNLYYYYLLVLHHLLLTLLAHHYGITHLLDIPCFCLLQSD
jgi:hypothetical protein